MSENLNKKNPNSNPNIGNKGKKQKSDPNAEQIIANQIEYDDQLRQQEAARLKFEQRQKPPAKQKLATEPKPLAEQKPASKKILPTKKISYPTTNAVITSIPKNNIISQKRNTFPLSIFNILNKAKTDQTSTPTYQNVSLFNNIAEYFQAQIRETKSLPSNQSLYVNDENPLDVKPYSNSVRSFGLFTSDNSSFLESPPTIPINLLEDPTIILKGNTILQSQQANPNGVLAISLYNCNEILGSNASGTRYSININTYNENKVIIERIRNASRGAALSADLKTAENLLQNTYEYLSSSVLSQEILINYAKIYFPFQLKGISDIAQYGSGKKYIIELIMKYKLEKESKIRELYSEPANYFKRTMGTPFMSGYSSDAIAATEGILMGYGISESVLPRKTPKGKGIVRFCPYNYVGLMRLLAEPGVFDPSLKEIHNQLLVRLNLFNSNLGLLTNLKLKPGQPQKSQLFSIDIKTNNFFVKLNLLLVDLYKIKIPNIDENFRDVYTIINYIRRLNFQDFMNNPNSNLDGENQKFIISVLESFEFLSLASSNLPGKDYQAIFSETLDYIESLFNQYSEFIISINEIVEHNNTLLEKAIEKLVNSSQISEVRVPSWIGTIYSSVAYYKTCQTLFTMNNDQLCNVYLDIAKQEEICSAFDVDFGHDQSLINIIQKIGNKVAEFLGKNEAEIRNMTQKGTVLTMSDAEVAAEVSGKPVPTNTSTLNKKNYFDQNDICAKLITAKKFCAFAEVYLDTEPELVIRFSNETKTTENLMFDTANFPAGMPTASIAKMCPLGISNHLATIDYTAAPYTHQQTKMVSNYYSFKSLQELSDYINNESLIEIIFPTTEFDAAAPSKCIYVKIGKQEFSGRIFTKEGQTYIYIIYTYDLSTEDNGKTDAETREKMEKGDCIRDFIKGDNIFFPEKIPDNLLRILEDKSNDLNSIYSQLDKFNNYFNSASNKVNFSVKLMLYLLNNYFKNSGSGLLKIAVSYPCEFINSINSDLSQLNMLREKSIQKKTAVSGKELRQASEPILKSIAITIGQQLELLYQKGELGDLESRNSIECMKNLLIFLNSSAEKVIEIPDQTQNKEGLQKSIKDELIKKIRNPKESQDKVAAAQAMLELILQEPINKNIIINPVIDALVDNETPVPVAKGIGTETNQFPEGSMFNKPTGQKMEVGQLDAVKKVSQALGIDQGSALQKLKELSSSMKANGFSWDLAANRVIDAERGSSPNTPQRTSSVNSISSTPSSEIFAQNLFGLAALRSLNPEYKTYENEKETAIFNLWKNLIDNGLNLNLDINDIRKLYNRYENKFKTDNKKNILDVADTHIISDNAYNSIKELNKKKKKGGFFKTKSKKRNQRNKFTKRNLKKAIKLVRKSKKRLNKGKRYSKRRKH